MSRRNLTKAAFAIVQPDVAKAGGLTACRRIATMASTRHTRISPHAWGSGAMFAAGLQVAPATTNGLVLKVLQACMPLRTDLLLESFEIQDGRIHGPDSPWLGYPLHSDIEIRFEYPPGPQYVYEPGRDGPKYEFL